MPVNSATITKENKSIFSIKEDTKVKIILGLMLLAAEGFLAVICFKASGGLCVGGEAGTFLGVNAIFFGVTAILVTANGTNTSQEKEQQMLVQTTEAQRTFREQTQGERSIY
jgi:hypothetical protein